MKEISTKNRSVTNLVARRQFLGHTAGLLGAAGLLAAASCSGNKHNNATPVNPYEAGSGDNGVYNFLYANEQLQAAFYTNVNNTPYANMSADEVTYLKDIRDHDITHQDFFKKLLGDNTYPSLTFDLSSIDFLDRNNVLSTAKMLKHNSIAAYNAVAYLLKSSDYLLVLGKIVSVEARHAATIGSLISYGTLLDDTNVDLSTSMELSQSPTDVLTVINSFLETKITANNLS